MVDSILITIKQQLGLGDTYDPLDAYDVSVMSNINTSIMILTQLGVGPKTGFRITGSDETWNNYIGNRVDLEGIKDYIYIKARIVFDPPSSAAALQALKEEAAMLESRIQMQADV